MFKRNKKIVAFVLALLLAFQIIPTNVVKVKASISEINYEYTDSKATINVHLDDGILRLIIEEIDNGVFHLFEFFNDELIDSDVIDYNQQSLLHRHRTSYVTLDETRHTSEFIETVETLETTSFDSMPFNDAFVEIVYDEDLGIIRYQEEPSFSALLPGELRGVSVSVIGETTTLPVTEYLEINGMTTGLIGILRNVINGALTIGNAIAAFTPNVPNKVSIVLFFLGGTWSIVQANVPAFSIPSSSIRLSTIRTRFTYNLTDIDFLQHRGTLTISRHVIVDGNHQDLLGQVFWVGIDPTWVTIDPNWVESDSDPLWRNEWFSRRVFDQMFPLQAWNWRTISWSDGDRATPRLSLSHDELILESWADNATINVTSNMMWSTLPYGEITSDQPWLSILDATQPFRSGNGSFIISAELNPGDQREARITVEAGGITETIKVIQNGIYISNAEQLSKIGGEQNEGRTFILTEDIDLKELGREWEPIDDFRGTLDGRGHAIRNLFIPQNSNRESAGLFGRIGDRGNPNVTIKNLRVSTTEGIHATGSVGHGGGGLVGFVNDGHLTISDSSFEGYIYGTHGIPVGGLVGAALGNVSISRSFAAGNAYSAWSTFSSHAGGLIGNASGSLNIYDSYTTNNITATSFAGGLVGHHSGVSSLTIARSYAIGVVEAQNAGGLVGHVDWPSGVTIDNAFRLSTQSVNARNHENDLGVERTPTQMRHSSNQYLPTWNFNYIWERQGIGVNFGFPVLRGLPAVQTVGVDRSELRAALNDADLREERNYSPYLYAQMRNVFYRARGVYIDENATQAQVDRATTDLRAALERLDGERPVNKEALNAAITYAESMHPANYSNWDFEWQLLQEPLETARNVSGNRQATQAEVDTATNTLRQALSRFDDIRDWNRLDTAISDGRSRSSNNYTSSSWTQMQEALDAAERILEDVHSTQNQINRAADALIEALDELIPIEPSTAHTMISNETELANIGGPDSEGRIFVLANDIVLTKEWVPIDDFRGTLDGNGYAIRNLFISSGSAFFNAGLFGRITGSYRSSQWMNSTHVTIKNLGVYTGGEGINVVGENAGGLVGYVERARLTIDNSYVIGDVQTRRDHHPQFVRTGGLIGFVLGDGSGHSQVRVSRSFVAGGNIISSGNAGGLVGEVYNGPLSIFDSYATNNVSSPTNAGGLVGRTASNRGLINRSYASGNVSANIAAGGLIGSSGTGFPAAGSFHLSSDWQIISGENTSRSLDILTPDQMRDPTNFYLPNWDFENIWERRGVDVNNGFPVLRGLPAVNTVEVNKRDLINALNDADLREERNYSAHDWGQMREAMRRAMDVAGNRNATQAEVDEVTRNLRATLDRLDSEHSVNKDELIAAIIYAESMHQANYSNWDFEWQLLQEPLETARSVRANGQSTQHDVDNATNTLRQALSRFDDVRVWDRLDTAISDARSRSSNNYTSSSWTQMQEALDTAERIREDVRTTQNQIDRAADALIEVLYGLAPRNPENVTRYNVLVIDTTDYMSRFPIQAARIITQNFINAALDASGTNYVAIITTGNNMGNTVMLRTGFTDNRTVLTDAVNRLNIGGNIHSMNDGLLMAEQILSNVPDADGSNIIHNVLLLSGSFPNSGTSSLQGPFFPRQLFNSGHANAVYLSAQRIMAREVNMYSFAFFRENSPGYDRWNNGMDIARYFKMRLQNGGFFEVTDPEDLNFAFCENIIVTVTALLTPPTFAAQPAPQTVTAGQNATFTIAVTGNPSPTMQWQASTDGMNWTNISGETGMSLTLTGVTMAMNGNQYRVVATNSEALDGVISDAAILTVSATITPTPPTTTPPAATPPPPAATSTPTPLVTTPTLPVTTPSPTLQVTTPTPTLQVTTSTPTLPVTTPTPTSPVTTPTSTSPVTTLTPTSPVTTLTPTSPVTTPTPTSPVTTPTPTSPVTTPTPTSPVTPTVTPTPTPPSEDEVSVADALYRLGLFVGTGSDSDGNPIFELNRPPTRLEALALVVRLMGLQNDAMAFTGDNRFTDIPAWGEHYAAFGYSIGITVGVNEERTLFASNRQVTAHEFTTFLLRVLGYNEADGDFIFEEAMQKASVIGFFSPFDLSRISTDNFLRDHSVHTMANALLTPPKGSNEYLLFQLADQGVFLRDDADWFSENVR